MSSRSSRSSTSPLRSRRAAAAPAAVATPMRLKSRPATPSSTTAAFTRPSTPSSTAVFARPSTPASVAGGGGRPTTPSSSGSGRPGTPNSSSGRPTTPSSSVSSRPTRPPTVLPPNSRENIMVTVRFRPLSAREINRGDEAVWFADGDDTVRNEYNPSIAYAFDRVFGPATTTRHVYDVAAQHVVRGAMEGINGTVFAYGVTSSGKTHTMHGEQKSPGIIPLAVKDVFNIIQDTPSREFLLRVSYLEIYNEVINDLLDPAGQNLRIREDYQGTYVEGIKEEVVLSPAHALSLIASGEELRHVGSNNFNLLSSRSHTVFTMTIESSSANENEEGEVRLSQLNLIDLAGSESSKTETTGLRRKEGAFINKSLLTLGTVIAKLTDGKSSHIPYRDSKLTRLLQSSLSGHGRISLICTLTPASSNSEETHNTLKFAHKSKHVEINPFENKIIDEKSLIKKYQKEIFTLKEELQQLKRGMMYKVPSNQQDLVNLKLQAEAGQVKLQSRLEEEEEAKAALLGRIQRLTKLILVSTKTSISPTVPETNGHRRRHSFGEDEKPEQLSASFDDESSTSGSPASSQASQKKDARRNSINKKAVGASGLADSVVARSQAGELFTAVSTERQLSRTGTTIMDQIDLQQEQIKLLAGEVALSTSTLKRLSEQASRNPGDLQIQDQIAKLTCEISEKKSQIRVLEQRMALALEPVDDPEINVASQSLSKLSIQLSEKTFELEIMIADNRILQDQLKEKISENAGLQETITLLRQQLSGLSKDHSSDLLVANGDSADVDPSLEIFSTNSNKSTTAHNMLHGEENRESSSLKSQVLMQAAEIDHLKQELLSLSEEKDRLEVDCEKLEEESSYAKELAASAASELKNLAEQVTVLAIENAKLTSDLAANQELVANVRRSDILGEAKRRDRESSILVEELQKKLAASCQREVALEQALSEKVQRETELVKIIENARCREQILENELAQMRAVVTNIIINDAENVVAEHLNDRPGKMQNGFHSGGTGNLLNGDETSASVNTEDTSNQGEIEAAHNHERRQFKELGRIPSRLKGEDKSNLVVGDLEGKNFHVEALSSK